MISNIGRLSKNSNSITETACNEGRLLRQIVTHSAPPPPSEPLKTLKIETKSDRSYYVTL